jgi:hypothetical protein
VRAVGRHLGGLSLSCMRCTPCSLMRARCAHGTHMYGWHAHRHAHAHAYRRTQRTHVCSRSHARPRTHARTHLAARVDRAVNLHQKVALAAAFRVPDGRGVAAVAAAAARIGGRPRDRRRAISLEPLRLPSLGTAALRDLGTPKQREFGK